MLTFFKGCCTKNQVSGKKRFSLILRIEIILLVMSYERKNIFFFLKNVLLTENSTFYNVFCNIIFFSTAPYQIFKKDWIFRI